MRAEASREELDLLLDMKVVDSLAENAAMSALKDIAEKLMIVTLMYRRNNIPAYLKISPDRAFENIMFYTVNKVVNIMNTRTEEGVRFADDVSKNLFGDKK